MAVNINGFTVIPRESNHTKEKIMIDTFSGDISDGYLNGFVIAKYLSKLIAQRLRIEAVDNQTSTASQILHQMSPNTQ